MRGFLYFLLGLFAWIPVSFYAIKGKYPEALVTPDDPVSPFGQYEERVRKVYEKAGKYIGDVYWLGFRNTLYGLKYKHKIPGLVGLTDYTYLMTNKQVIHYKNVSITKYDLLLEGEIYTQHTIRLWKLYIMFGHKIDSIHNDKFTPRQPVNMEGRPFFTLRTNRSA
jgi:hypothetical protein